MVLRVLVRSLVSSFELTASGTAAPHWELRVELGVLGLNLVVPELLLSDLSVLLSSQEAEVIANVSSDHLESLGAVSSCNFSEVSVAFALALAAGAAVMSLKVVHIEFPELQELIAFVLAHRVIAVFVDILVFWSDHRNGEQAVHLGLLREANIGVDVAEDRVEAELVLRVQLRVCHHVRISCFGKAEKGSSDFCLAR